MHDHLPRFVLHLDDKDVARISDLDLADLLLQIRQPVGEIDADEGNCRHLASAVLESAHSASCSSRANRLTRPVEAFPAIALA